MTDLPPARVRGDVLASLLQKQAVPMSVLHERYGPLLKLVKVLIGVVPNCDGYLEIWPPAFRSYNIIVPNLLNLPFSLFGVGTAPKDVVGLGMYVSSRAAECAYCSAHTCSFALRRGASPEKVAQALTGSDQFNPRELAAISVARSLARVPCELTSSERDALNDCFTAEEAEWIVLGIVMMGYLNKFMDAMGVDLETSTVAETQEIMGGDWNPGKAGWNLQTVLASTSAPKSDSLLTKLSVIRHAPAALRLDAQWQLGVPDTWPAVGEYLVSLTGHDFPVLSRMTNARAIRAVASTLRENLNPETTLIGLSTKALAGIVFSEVIQNECLSKEIRVVGLHAGVSYEQMDAIASFATGAEVELPFIDNEARVIMILARAASPSPAEITAEVVNTVRHSKLSPAAIVELINWLSVLQMLHRLSSYYTAGSTIQIVNFLRLVEDRNCTRAGQEAV